MEWQLAGGLIGGSIILAILSGIPVAFAFLGVNLIASVLLIGGMPGLLQVVANASSTLTSFTLAPIPLFIFMGALFFHTGLAHRVFETIDALLGTVRGRLCYVTVAGGTAFSSLTGSSMANTSMLGALLVPEMMRRGYSTRMSIGPIIGTGGLAMIIPPSTMSVVLASLAGLNVGALLIAGLLPGLLLAGLYVTAIYLQIRANPDETPNYTLPPRPLPEKLRLCAVNLLPMLLIVFSVIGLIILGIATPTEASAFGVLSTGLVAIGFRGMSWDAVGKSLDSTVRVTGMALLIVLGSSTFSQLLAFSGASSGLLRWAAGLEIEAYALLAIMFVILLVLGMLMDQYSMMLLTVPLFFPLAIHLGFDPIWFAVVVLMSLEMSLATPPFGLLLFLMLGVAPPGTRLGQVVKAALPFLACDAILVLILVLFPALALYLPRLAQ